MLDPVSHCKTAPNIDVQFCSKSTIRFCLHGCKLEAPKTAVSFCCINHRLRRSIDGSDADYARVGAKTRHLLLRIFRKIDAVDNNPDLGGIHVSETVLSIDTIDEVNTDIAREVVEMINLMIFDGKIDLQLPIEDSTELKID